MTRRWHILKGNKGCETAQNVVYFDTETKPTRLADGGERDRLWFGWLCAKSRTSKGNWGPGRWESFSKVKHFWEAVDAIVRGRTRWFFFCHNTSYDLPIVDVFNTAKKFGWICEAAVIEAPPTIITFRRKDVTITFVDTLNWWRMPLEKLGERVGLAKLVMPSNPRRDLDWDTYCKRDVEVLVRTVEAWLDFLVTYDLGGFAVTLASQAFRTYRHRFMQHEIHVPADPWESKLAREAYHGGRVECFRLGEQKGPIYAFDINAMYPAVMRHNLYPHKYIGGYPTQSPTRWEALLDRYSLVARCRVRATVPAYPMRTAGGLSFPLGVFETTLTTPEISLAMSRGDLLEMHDIAVYEKADIFTGFVEFFWKQRRQREKAKDPVGSWLFKIMSNSLYGKFGQTGQVYEEVSETEDMTAKKWTEVDWHTKKVVRCRQLAGLVQKMSSEGEARDSFPAIAAHVTAYARLLLWKLIETACIENVLYCDTDSLFVTQEGADLLRRWVRPTQLGKLKAIGQWPWMTIHGLKDYEYPGHKVRKGVRAKATQIGPNTFQQLQWSSLKGLLGKGDMTAPTRKMITKTLKREYKKPRAV